MMRKQLIAKGGHPYRIMTAINLEIGQTILKAREAGFDLIEIKTLSRRCEGAAFGVVNINDGQVLLYPHNLVSVLI